MPCTREIERRTKVKTYRSYKRSQIFKATLMKETNLGALTISGFTKEPAIEAAREKETHRLVRNRLEGAATRACC